MRNSFCLRSSLSGIAAGWIIGLLLGAFFAAGMDDAVLSLMRLMLSAQVSIVGVFLCALLPFLFAAYAVMIERDSLLYAVLLLRGFSLGCGIWLTVRLFGSAAWLVQPLAQFTGNISSAVLLLAALRWQGRPHRVKRELICVSVFLALVSAADCFAVSAFLAALLDY